MKKLDNRLKDFIKNSIGEININELKYLVMNYGNVVINRIMKIINFLRLKNKLIIKHEYSSFSKYSTNYYNYTHDQLLKFGYILINGFYTKIIKGA